MRTKADIRQLPCGASLRGLTLLGLGR